MEKYKLNSEKNIQDEDSISQGSSDDESSEEMSASNMEEESGDESAFDTKNQNEVLETLLKLKRKDPSIYNKDAKFYSSEETPPEDDHSTDSKHTEDEEPQKPMLLRDFHAEMILEGGEKVLEEKEQEFEKQRPKTKKLLYNEQQRENLKEFQNVVNEQLQNDESDDDLLGFLEIKQAKNKDTLDTLQNNDDDNHDKFDNYTQKQDQKQMLDENNKDQDDEKQKKIELLGQVFNEQDEQDRFLKDYLLKERWKGAQNDDSDGGLDGDENLLDDVDLWKDEEYMEQADYFEKTFNARFEEEGKDKLVSFPREAPASVREKKSRKKRQREARAARSEEKQQEQERELKRQKNIKTKEIKQMVEQIQKEAGGKVDGDKIMNALLSGGDVSEFYKNLDEAFGEEYYNAQDDEYNEDNQFDDDNSSQNTKNKIDEDTNMEYDDADQDDADVDNYGYDMDYEEDMESQKVDRQKLKEQLAEKVEEYHNLDFEQQTTDGVKWRFNYTQVPKEHFGLTPDEILKLSDKDLNQVVGIARLAPYKQQKIRPNYKKLQELTQRSFAGHASKAWQSDPILPNNNNRRSNTNKKGTETTQKKKVKIEIKKKENGNEKESEEIVDPVKQRMSSFQTPKLPAKLQIKKEKKEKMAQKLKQKQQIEQNDKETNKLTKSQQRNLRRAKKRQEKKQQT